MFPWLEKKYDDLKNELLAGDGNNLDMQSLFSDRLLILQDSTYKTDLTTPLFWLFYFNTNETVCQLC
jgi:hypothetical protein